MKLLKESLSKSNARFETTNLTKILVPDLLHFRVVSEHKVLAAVGIWLVAAWTILDVERAAIGATPPKSDPMDGTRDSLTEVSDMKSSLLIRTVSSGEAVGIRLQAITSLGRLRSVEAVPTLIQMLIEDKNDQIRAACATALGRIGELTSRPALRAALQDTNNEVRQKALVALELLGSSIRTSPAEPQAKTGSSISVAIGRMGTRAHGTLPDLPRRLRDAINRELTQTPGVRLINDTESSGYTVESSITELSQRVSTNGLLEINCEVSMVIGVLPSRSIVGMTSGGATVQAPRLAAKPTKAVVQAMEMDALTYAVRGAHQNLVAFLRNRR